MNTTQTPPPVKKAKKKGPIRTEAVIPFLIVSVLTFVYFHFFFDLHLKKAMEFAGYQVLGAEVDIANLETSFFKGTFRAQGIEITNAEKPTHNMVAIGDVRFGVLWDGLLRARLVVEEMAVEQIEIDKPRKSPGRVKPPEPIDVSADPNAPSALERAKDKAAGVVEKKYEQNVLGDLAALLGGTSGTDQLAKIEGSIPSKAKLQELEKEYKAKQAGWDAKIKSLPKTQEIQALGDRLGKVKTSNFKTPQELQTSLSEIDAILKEADAKYKVIESTGGELSSDLKQLDAEFKELDAMIKKDIKDLETRFRIPKLDAKSLSTSIFMSYLQPYINQFSRYKELAVKYAPPKFVKKNGKDEPTGPEFQPHPREKGMVYEFALKNSYPMFWVKKISISSQAGGSAYSGNLKGLVTDVTSNQMLVGKPTVAKLDGDFPAQQVTGFTSLISVDNRKPDSEIKYQFGVGGYAIDGKELVNSPDVQIAFKKAVGGLTSKGQLIGLRDFTFDLNNQFRNVEYNVGAKDGNVQSILQGVFAGLPNVSLDVDGKGVLPAIDLNINSNLGPELQKGFEKQIQKKIDEARAKLQAFIDETVGKEKAKLEGDFNKVKAQIDGEVKKVQNQIEAEKAKATGKTDQAKKDAENQAKKGVEDQVKKALGGDGEKKLDDLKKQFGW